MNTIISKAVFKIIKNPDTRWKLKLSFPKVFFSPHMKPEEYLLFKQICNNKNVFIEYGSGGSTIYLLKNKKEVYSVESNPDFYNDMKSIGLVRRSLSKNLHYRFIDLGETNKWGKPLNTEKSNSWSEYYEQVWSEIDPLINKVDVVFIDGRFRVCCCLYTILKLVQYNWKDTVLMIHDFRSRERYHVVLKFVEEIKSAKNLVCFKVKENINVDELKETLLEYALVID